MMARTKVLLFGAGGHGRVVFDVLDRQGRYAVALVVDDAVEAGRDFCGMPVSGGREQLKDLDRLGISDAIIAVGDNRHREQVARFLAAARVSFIVAIDPGAQVGRDVTIGAGTVVMPGAVINAGTRIGEHAILNTSCSVDHDCRIESFVHVSPGVHAGGGCTFGEGAHIGIGATVIDGIRIGARAMIGAGAVVVDDVPAGVLAVGVPARPIRRE
jgi:sugar O-acyltransferase (sialic acid O-acetyltransferase NeuD family)